MGFKYKIFSADKNKGFNFPFIALLPDKPDKNVKIFVESANSHRYAEEGQSNFNAQMLDAIAYANSICNPSHISPIAQIYDTLNQPVIIPVIERCDKEHISPDGTIEEFYTQMLGKNVVHAKEGKYAKLSEQIVNMVNEMRDVLTKRGHNVSKKSGLIGMSSSGVFAGRMQFIHPEEFDVCLSICSNAVQPLPIDVINGVKLPYPLGTADYKELFGKEFNKEEYAKAKQLFIVGKEEQNSKYNIIHKPLLFDPETRTNYINAYGCDYFLQDRQKEYQRIVNDLGYNNITAIVSQGGHDVKSKLDDISSWSNNNFNLLSKENKSNKNKF